MGRMGQPQKGVCCTTAAPRTFARTEYGVSCRDYYRHIRDPTDMLNGTERYAVPSHLLDVFPTPECAVSCRPFTNRHELTYVALSIAIRLALSPHIRQREEKEEKEANKDHQNVWWPTRALAAPLISTVAERDLFCRKVLSRFKR